ncbi:MAG: hypothetical protein IV100_14915 [Myxococcales bacterium]|nr:hypothetical protein [Myxococcales bacterium]
MSLKLNSIVLASLVLLGCGANASVRTEEADGDDAQNSSEADSRADASPGDIEPGGDTAAPPIEVPADNVTHALADCLGHYKVPEEFPNQMVEGNELQRYTLSDPEAVCNDGTRAVMYVRGYTDAALADTWSIHLQGGGGCGSYVSCALRWCGRGQYDSSKMSSRNLPLNVAGFGIYDDKTVNFLAGANQVFFYYCSSDAWRGEGSAAYAPGDLELPAEVPEALPGELPDYSVFRRGHTILASGLDELTDGLVADDGEVLPALDDASFVVFSGTSGGSAGARANADYVRERLSAKGAEVVAVFDAAHVPLSTGLSEPYATALDDAKEVGWLQSQATDDTLPFMDATCWAHLGGTANEGACYDVDYLMLNHITTPFFVRQDLSDEGGLAESVGLPEDEFEAATIATLRALATLRESAVEGKDITVVPGAYGPNCAQHVALESTTWWAVGTVEDDAGALWTFEEAVSAWRDGAAVAIVDGPTAGPGNGPGSVCPAHED